MRKTTVNLSIDSNVVEGMQIRYPKRLSAMTEDYWKSLMGKSLEDCDLKDNIELVDKLKGDLAKANVEQFKYQKDIERRKKESVKDENQRIEEFMNSDQFFLKMKEMQTLKDMSSKFAVQRYEIVMNSLIHDTGKNRAEIEKMIASKIKPTSPAGLNLKNRKT